MIQIKQKMMTTLTMIHDQKAFYHDQYICFLFLAVTRKYAFPLRPLANQNQSAFQHLFQTDLGRSPRGNDSSPTTQEEHKAQKTNNNQVLNTLRRQLKTPKQTNADVQDHASPSVSSVCLTHSFIGEKVCLRVNNS